MKTVYQSLLIAAIVLLGILPVAAQNKITLNHLGVPSLYTNLSAAITAAVNGDTLYLPGSIILPYSTDITISKSVHIVGTGHYPDSTIATNTTMINTIRFLTGSGGSSIEGCIIYNLYIGYAATQNIQGFSVKRCSVGLFRLGFDNVSTFENIILTDNVFTAYFNFREGYTTNILITRNIFNASGSSSNIFGRGLLFSNNIIYCYYSSALASLTECVLENNIIIGCNYNTITAISYLGSTNCQYANNLFIPNVSNWGTNTQINSILGQTTATTFVNANTSGFLYGHNYHLLSTSPGKNYGTDGTDAGIYGTSSPYKDGAMPFNPHIMSKSISGQTTLSGALNVNISVSAQQY